MGRVVLLAAASVGGAASIGWTGCAAPEVGDPESLTVFAAASLTDAFSEMARAFESSAPGTEVRLAFAGSHVLRMQIEQGAPADVFVSADPRHMESLVQAGLVDRERYLAGNELVVIVPARNPSGIESFADLAWADRVVIGTPGVPVGAYTRQMLHRAGRAGGIPDFEREVMGRVVSEESNVRLVRAKVELGEADAAVVYRSDAVEGRVRTVAIPPEYNVRARYLIGMVVGARNASAARRWGDFAASAEGRGILARHGFLTDAASAQ